MRRITRVLVAVVVAFSSLLLVQPPTPAAAAAATLSVKATSIVDGTGAAWKMVGVARMGTEYACQQGWGIFDGPVDQSYIDLLKSWKVNTMRIPLNEHCWLGISWQPNTTGATYRTAITDWVNRLNANGITAVLDLHFTGPNGAPGAQENFMPNRNYSLPFWKSVATAFKSNRSVMFELFNEPRNISWDCWRNGCTTSEGWQAVGMQELITAIRGVGAVQPVILNGLDWGHDMRSMVANLPTDSAGQLVAGQHLYNFKRCATASCWDAEFAPVAAHMPFITGELGQNTCDANFVTSFMKWSDAKGADGYGIWHGGVGECPPGYQYGGSAMLSSYNGTLTNYGAGVKAYFASAASSTPPPEVPTEPTEPTTCTGFNTSFFNNATLSGTPVLNRCDTAVNYDWAGASPGPGVNADQWSARWSQSVDFAAGTYNFTLTGDDGIRLRIDGVEVVNGWRDQAATTYTGQRTLTAGRHDVVIEFYDSYGNAVAKASWAPTSGTTTTTAAPTTTTTTIAPTTSCSDYAAQYFNNTTLSGTPAVTRCEAKIDSDYGGGSPAAGISSDNFSARWTKTAQLAAGTYDFTVTGDDGIRLKVDGVELVNGWKDQAPTTYTARKTLTAGTHTIVVEYYEKGGGAVARAAYSMVETNPVVCPTGQWSAEYFANRYLSSPTARTACESAVNNEWGAGGPIVGVTDNFSARWTQVADMAAGNYTFTVTGDDGIRMYLDGVLIIDGWKDQAPTTYTTTRSVAAGSHEVIIEYYEAGSGAVAKGSWRAA